MRQGTANYIREAESELKRADDAQTKARGGTVQAAYHVARAQVFATLAVAVESQS